MDKGLITQLLKTPSQIRAEEQKALREKGLQRAALVRGSGGAGASLFGGMFRDFAAQQAADVDQRTQQMFQGLGGALGVDMRSAAEQQAVKQQEVLRGTDMTNLQSLKTRRQMLVDSGVPATALEAIDRQIMMLEDKKKAEIDADAAAKAAAAQQAFENQARLAELAIDQQDLGLRLGGIDLKNATVDSQGAAATILDNGPQEGETPAEHRNRARAALKTIDKSTSTTVNVDQKGESAFAKKLGEKDATAFAESETQMDNVDRSLNVLREGRQILEEGIISGFGAEVRLDFERAKKLFNLTDASEDELIVRTETYMKNMANATLAILGSGDLGTGTGLSDKDREFAQDVVAGNIALDEAALRRIIEINEKANVFRVQQHNALVAKNNERYGMSLPMRYYEGQTATGPNGEEIIYRSGSWEQVQ